MSTSAQRTLVLGNSGSGKSTLARRLAAARGVTYLELDTLVWDMAKGAVERPRIEVERDVHTFDATNDAWVVEGCDGDVLVLLLPRCTELLFLNPGVEACVLNNRRRPWEPHKFATRALQDANLEPLLEWVRNYHTRDDARAYRFHRALFDGFDGAKRELFTAAEIEGLT